MTLGSHQRTIGKSQVHITPKWIIDALGPFDLDPCAAWPRPWDCASFNAKEDQNGLNLMWGCFGSGLVFLNPPFHRYEVHKWVEKLAQHNNGIALLHARTETEWFRPCWQHASAILFMAQRIAFCRPDGSEQPANSGAPPVLVAFGETAKQRLGTCGIAGALVTTWSFRKGSTP
jgi:hypothetical protein